MKMQPTYQRVRLGRWIAVQPMPGEHHDNGDGTIDVDVSGYAVSAPSRRLAARRLARFVGQQVAA